MPLCRVQKKGTRQRRILPSAKKNSTRQNISLPSAKKRHSAKMYFAECHIFAECQKKGTRQRRILPSVEKCHSAKYIFAECRKNTRQSHLCRVPKKTLGKAVFAECPIKYTRQSFRHSAKCRFPVVVTTNFEAMCTIQVNR